MVHSLQHLGVNIAPKLNHSRFLTLNFEHCHVEAKSIYLFQLQTFHETIPLTSKHRHRNGLDLVCTGPK